MRESRYRFGTSRKTRRDCSTVAAEKSLVRTTPSYIVTVAAGDGVLDIVSTATKLIYPVTI